ncbi:hypothetical protein ACB087_06765 [Vibrio sp. VNB-15]
MDLSQFPAGIFVPKHRQLASRMARVPPSVVAAVGAAAGSYVGGKFTNALNAATANNQLSHGNGMSALGSAGGCNGSCHG